MAGWASECTGEDPAGVPGRQFTGCGLAPKVPVQGGYSGRTRGTAAAGTTVRAEITERTPKPFSVIHEDLMKNGDAKLRIIILPPAKRINSPPVTGSLLA
jgi:hypothetical protein